MIITAWHYLVSPQNTDFVFYEEYISAIVCPGIFSKGWNLVKQSGKFRHFYVGKNAWAHTCTNVFLIKYKMYILLGNKIMPSGYHQIGWNCVFLNNTNYFNQCFPRSTRKLYESPVFYFLFKFMLSCEYLCGFALRAEVRDIAWFQGHSKLLFFFLS